MIPNNFIYCRPENPAEAVEAFSRAENDGLRPLYLAGGTEITTFCRSGKIEPGALIDIKRVPECRRLAREGDEIILGSALTLNEVVASGVFPLLARASAIVDHTVRNRLTLGGNIAGRLPYRETVLPLLLAEARVRLAGPGGERLVPAAEVFSKRLLLEKGELLVDLRVPGAAADLPWFYRRRVRKTRVDYPLLTACFLKVDGAVRMAVTGAFGFPLRPTAGEKTLNDPAVPPADRPRLVIEAIPHKIVEDMRASGRYRRMLLEKCLGEAMDTLGGGG